MFQLPRISRKFLLFIAICGLVFVHVASGQNITGTIVGIVTDPLGAVVPNATVTIVNLETKEQARTIRTNARGEYTATTLAVGSYSVSVTAPSYEVTDVPNVTLNVGDTVTVNAVMKIGGASETVTVNAVEVAPNTETPENSSVINELQMKELALNTRNFEQMLLLEPGVSYGGSDELSSGLVSGSGGTNPHSLSINGLQPNQLSFNFDGADVLDHSSIQQSVLFPSVESVNQIKILRDSYGAQYGGGGSAQVLIVSRAGGSKLHGNAYFFLRNQYLNANSFLNLVAVPIIARPTMHYDNYGIALGGPLGIPKWHTLKDTFFFYSQEIRSIAQAASPVNQNQYPYLSQAMGYFAHPVCVDPHPVPNVKCTIVSPAVTNSPFAGNNYYVPTSAAAQGWLKDMILPALAIQQPNNTAKLQAAVISSQSVTHDDQILARIDKKFSDRFSMFFRYIFDPYHLVVPFGYGAAGHFPGVNNSNLYNYGENFLVHGTFTATPSTVVDFGYSYLPYEIKNAPTGTSLATNSPDIRVAEPYTNTTGIVPSLEINNVTWNTVGLLRNLNHTQQVFVNVTQQVGVHTLLFGGNYEHYYATVNQASTNAGVFDFESVTTTLRPAGGATNYEQAFANFLEGLPVSFTQSSIDPTAKISQNLSEVYFQDNWRIKPRLTLQLGVRYSLYGQPYDRAGHLGAFQPQSYYVSQSPTLGTDGSICFAGISSSSCTGLTPNANYNPLNGIVQGGKNSPYGRAITQRSYTNIAPRIGFAYNVYGDGKTSLRGGFGIFYDQVALATAESEVEQNPAYVSETTFNYPSFSNPGGTAATNTLPVSSSGVQANWKSPYTMSYSLSVQQTLAPSWVLNMAYVGNKTIHLQGVVDLNQAIPGEFAAATYAATGTALSGTNNAQLINNYRPYRGYSAINFYDTGFKANYNGLQVGMIKSFTKSRGAHISLNYTWSKALTNSNSLVASSTVSNSSAAAPQNTYDLKSEYGPTTLDKRALFNASIVYHFPWYREQHGFKGKLLGGYEISSIILFNSGFWRSPMTAQDTGGVGSSGSGTFSVQRPDQVGDPNTGPKNYNEYFNTAAFTQVPTNPLDPTTFRVGNAKVGTILLPGQEVVNLTVMRNIDLPKSLRLQLRLEAFNAFNHVNWSNVALDIGSTNFGGIQNAQNNRQLQIAAKLYF